MNSAANAFEIPVLLHGSEDFPHTKYSAAWKKTTQLIKEGIHSVQKLFSFIEKHSTVVNCVEYRVIEPHYIGFTDVNSLVEKIKALILIISNITNMFGDIPISDSLKWLKQEALMLNKLLETTTTEMSIPEQSSVNNYLKLVESLTEKILFAIQGICKKYNTQVESLNKDTDEEESEETYTLYDSHLKVMMTENLCDDVAILGMKGILSSVNKVAKVAMVLDPSKNRNLQAILSRTVPLLEQVTLLYEYFITQQVSAYRVTCKMSSILLNIFIELVSKVSFNDYIYHFLCYQNIFSCRASVYHLNYLMSRTQKDKVSLLEVWDLEMEKVKRMFQIE